MNFRRWQVKWTHRLKRLLAAATPWTEIGRHFRRGDATLTGLSHVAIHPLASRRAVDQAERAIHAGNLLRAEMALHEGLRHDPTMPRLHELSAAVALERGRPDDAIQTLTRMPARTAPARLLLALARTQAGDAVTAHLDLASWTREDDCPAEARVLLATLELASGDRESARRALAPNAERLAHPLCAAMLVLIDLADELPRAAEYAAGELAHSLSHRPFTQRWLATLELEAKSISAEPAPHLVDHLAEQLRERMDLAPALIRAQREEPAAARIRLIRRAMTRLVDEVAEPMIAVEALAELAEIVGDRDDAARWARRGLKIDPYSAKLAMLLDRVTEDDIRPSIEQLNATDALERAAAGHPGYEDVRRALILRYHRSGLRVQASRAADRWLREQPESPVAARTFQELAA